MSGHRDLGRAYLERARPDLAEEELRRALAEDPDDPEALALLGHALVSLDRARDAMEVAEQAVGAAPDWAEPHLVLARAHLALSRAQQAEASARTALAIDPEESRGHSLTGWALAEQRRWREALEAAEAGLELDPESRGCGNLRARALIHLGEADGADFALGDQLRRDPENPMTHANLGWAALHRGDHEQATRHYREALRLDPSFDHARAGLVEALKARNLVYRTLLRFGLWLTRIPSRTVVLLMVGSVLARNILRNLAVHNPSVAPALWTIYFGIVAFIILTWVAGPVFNLLLRFHPDGRYALHPLQVRQANWFAGWLFATLVVLGVWVGGGPVTGIAPLFMALMLIPISTAAGEGDERQVRVYRWALAFLLLTGGFASIQHAFVTAKLEAGTRAEAPAYSPELVTPKPGAPEGKPLTEMSSEEVLAASRQPAESELIERRRDAEGAFGLFILGLVAFSWFRSGTFTTGTR